MVLTSSFFSLASADGLTAITGSWDRQGDALDFYADGRLEQELPSTFSARYSTYRVSDQRLLLQWKLPKAEHQTCGFSVKSDNLMISCGDGQKVLLAFRGAINTIAPLSAKPPSTRLKD